MKSWQIKFFLPSSSKSKLNLLQISRQIQIYWKFRLPKTVGLKAKLFLYSNLNKDIIAVKIGCGYQKQSCIFVASAMCRIGPAQPLLVWTNIIKPLWSNFDPVFLGLVKHWMVDVRIERVGGGASIEELVSLITINIKSLEYHPSYETSI